MLSAIVITKNEEDMITDCLKSLQFAQELLVVDTGNTDKTNDIAKKHGAKIVTSSGTGYAQFRNDGLLKAQGDWVLFVDADERVSEELKDELVDIMQQNATDSVYALPRKNIYLGKHLQFGGWGDDYVIRFFPRSQIQKYVNDLHEQPLFTGALVKLKNKLIHYSHRGLFSMTNKTIQFTEHEARLRLESNHPQIKTWRLMRVMFSEFWYRFINKSAWRDGPEGIIDGLFQVFNMFIIYARVWESQVNVH